MLKVGSKVTIRKDLKRMTYYSKNDSNKGDAAIEEMFKYRNEIATITEKTQSGFRLDIDNGRFNWIDTMFEDSVLFQILNKDKLNHCDDCINIEKCKIFKSLYENETICSILDLIDNL